MKIAIILLSLFLLPEIPSIVDTELHFPSFQIETAAKGKGVHVQDKNHGHPGIYMRFRLHKNGTWGSTIGHPEDPHAHHWVGGTWTSRKKGWYLLTPHAQANVLNSMEYMLNGHGHGVDAQTLERWLIQMKVSKNSVTIRGRTRANGVGPNGADVTYVRIIQRLSGKTALPLHDGQ